MFDIGFSEMVLTALVALVVLGPEKLPKVARWIGRFTGQAKAYMQSLSTELEREGHLADLKRQLAETERMARAHADEINRAVMMNAPHDALPAPPPPVMTALPAPASLPPPPATPAEPIDVEIVATAPLASLPPTPTPPANEGPA